MKKVWKILLIIWWCLFVAGAGTLVGFVEVEQYKRTCKSVNIQIDYGAADVLITRHDVDSIIRRTAGSLKGRPLGYINISLIEKAIRKQPYVAKVRIYENNKGDLFVNVRQRKPILRIINEQYENFYLDESGILLPVNPDFSARVLVASGNIGISYIQNTQNQVNMLALSDSMYFDSQLTNLYKLTMYIIHDNYLKAQIDQIYVNDLGEFELIPRVGGHIIIFGEADDLDAKFKKLLAFYKYGLNKIGWNKYTIINIKFKNQVLCSKQ
jgi:cell division protein FtsQ